MLIARGPEVTDYLWLVIALPMAGSLFLHFFGRYVRAPWSGWLASAAIGGAFLIALVAALPFLQGGEDATTILLWEWIPAIGASFELMWDPLSALMTLVVTGVGALIHIFAIGYMHGDERFHRFFTYLNLFAASMLALVLAGNYAMLFLGWELVGLCSYLLIGFWFTRPSAAAAAKKAFVVNRIGDFGFMVGLMLVFATFGTLSFGGVFERAGAELSSGLATAIALLFLLGAAGKSAQIPLYVWLPDAMEGPTPVSALIHAATMVTAGVYVIARSAPIYELTPFASTVVASVGALTAIWAASIALAQRDIKRVLAYSTISQLGFMFLAVGTAAYVAGVFLLMTHAFFKALLFLGAGSVIHAISDEQDMHKMGGLRRRMPITAVTMGIASLALAQRDIKRVLAYSTISQLGFMFLAVGTAAYVAGVFHLMTHAFFKALLFLGAGSVIHAMSDEQDMHKMGGLRPMMRITAATMGVASLALAGIPPLAGFWSKDEILAAAFARGGWYYFLWVIGLVTALLTAFYITRLWVLVFLGEPRWDQSAHPHESPRVMTVPLLVLAALSVLGGLVNTPFRLALEHFLEPSFELVHLQHAPDDWMLLGILAGLSTLAALGGAAAGYLAYNRPPARWRRFEDSFQPLWGAWEQAYGV
ncbi:MAG TPA: NADH-quinone oxidoreductase subunit L, partial [Acidimicrobiia bacterium]|nr:NADH-quinone oxidoreductase subunit L [Acidimicrobiia bacterium]